MWEESHSLAVELEKAPAGPNIDIHIARFSEPPMTHDHEMRRLGYDRRRLGWAAQSFVGKALTFAAAAVLLVAAIAISLAVFAVAMIGVLVVGAYIWWRTRDLRKQMRASSSDSNVIEGRVIEGQVVREMHARDSDQR
jgi:Flp pilus assembly protein TadB